MQQNNQPQRNNPWGFQAMNQSQPLSRGPPSQQAYSCSSSQSMNNRSDIHMNRFAHPDMPRKMMPQFGHHQGRPQLRPQQYNQNSSLNGPHTHRPQHGPPYAHGQQHGPPHTHRPQHGPVCDPGQMLNRPPVRLGVGPPPDFLRMPGSFQHRPSFQPDRQYHERSRTKKQKKNLKKKLSAHVLPADSKYYCDTCDKGYKAEDAFQLHIDQHEKCTEEGCSYIASGKLVQLHIKMQHNSGMAKKIWSVESKEDLLKWQEERKKKFPTAENIEKKKVLQAERVARGEVIEEKYFGKMHKRQDNQRGCSRGRGRDNGRGRGRNQDDRGQQDNMKRKLEADAGSECSTEKHPREATGERSLKQEAAESLSMFFAAESSDSDSSDSDDNNTVKIKPSTGSETSAVPAIKAAGGLGSLMSSYADSSEEDDLLVKVLPPNVLEEHKVNEIEAKDRQNSNDKRPRQRNRQKKNKGKFAPPPRLDKSLLEKLLAKEIRQERNKIMQCVHYIVKKDFFENVNN